MKCCLSIIAASFIIFFLSYLARTMFNIDIYEHTLIVPTSLFVISITILNIIEPHESED